jgi:hypothetical protein
LSKKEVNPVTQPDWRIEQVRKFAREMMTNCDQCPQGCGAMVCGNEQRKTHKQFHKQLDDGEKGVSARLNALERDFNDFRSTVLGKDQEQDATLLNVKQRLAALENPPTPLYVQVADAKRKGGA